MTDQNADSPMIYRVIFTVEVTDPEPLIAQARAMSAELQGIVNLIGSEAEARRRPKRDPDDQEPEDVSNIEEALCWVLPSGEGEDNFDIIDAEAVLIGDG